MEDFFKFCGLLRISKLFGLGLFCFLQIAFTHAAKVTTLSFCFLGEIVQASWRHKRHALLRRWGFGQSNNQPYTIIQQGKRNICCTWKPCPSGSGLQVWTLIFCYQNCSDLLWVKIVLVIKKNNLQITRTIYSNSERSEQFLVTEWFFNLFLEVSHI